MAAGDAAGAVDRLARGLASGPRSPALRWHLALALSAAGREDDAARAADEAVALAPESAVAHLVRGRVLLDAGRLEEAGASLDRALAVEPANLVSRGWRAVAHFDRGEVASGLSLLSPPGVGENPELLARLVAAMEARAIRLRRREPPGSAECGMRSAESKADSSAPRASLRAWLAAKWRRSRFERAMADVEGAVSARRYLDALERAREGAALDPADPKGLAYIGWAHFRCGQVEEAHAALSGYVERLGEALAEHPLAPSVTAFLARTTFRRGDFAPAREWLDRSLEIRAIQTARDLPAIEAAGKTPPADPAAIPGKAKDRALLGAARFLAGDYEAARRLLEAHVQAMGEGKQGKDAIGRVVPIFLGRACQRLGDTAAGRHWLDRAMERETDDPEDMLTHGVLALVEEPDPVRAARTAAARMVKADRLHPDLLDERIRELQLELSLLASGFGLQKDAVLHPEG